MNFFDYKDLGDQLLLNGHEHLCMSMCI